MNYNTILRMQKEYGYSELQKSINNGNCWHLEGSYGRGAMNALEQGMCMLPKVVTYDAYGGKVPSRDMVAAGSKGSYKNCLNFWERVEDGSVFLEKECTDDVKDE